MMPLSRPRNFPEANTAAAGNPGQLRVVAIVGIGQQRGAAHAYHIGRGRGIFHRPKQHRFTGVDQQLAGSAAVAGRSEEGDAFRRALFVGQVGDQHAAAEVFQGFAAAERHVHRLDAILRDGLLVSRDQVGIAQRAGIVENDLLQVAGDAGGGLAVQIPLVEAGGVAGLQAGRDDFVGHLRQVEFRLVGAQVLRHLRNIAFGDDADCGAPAVGVLPTS